MYGFLISKLMKRFFSLILIDSYAVIVALSS